MPLIPTLLTSGGQDSGSDNISSVNTASISPRANGLIILAVAANKTHGSGTPNDPTVSGGGLSWTEIGTVTLSAGGEERLTLFKAQSPTPGSPAVVNISWGGQQVRDVYWSIAQYYNASVNGDAVVQSVVNGGNSITSLGLSLSAFANPNDYTHEVVYLNDGSPQPVPIGANMNTMNSFNSSHIFTTGYGINSPSTGWTTTTSRSLLGMAIQIKARRKKFFGAMI